MEASAVHAPTRFARLTSSPTLLRLRSDEQLVSLLRGGSQEAFRAIHDRYGQRLFTYVRQMLGPGSRQDAEDVLQDVFARTYATLKDDDRHIDLRPWLYRVAHNRCIDHLRRPGPVTAELVETSARALHDPFEEVQRREDLQRLVNDISRLPEQQKSALLLREINGLSYRELAEALDVTVPAVKSLLVRARLELVETAEARLAACGTVREELALAYDTRNARPSPRARRHLRDCAGCREYRAGMRGMRRSFAALSPMTVAGPLALGAKLVGFGGSSGGTSAGGGLAASASSGGLAGGASTGGLAVGTAGKIAAVVSTAAITAGGAVEIERRVSERSGSAPAADTRPAPGPGGEPPLPAAVTRPASTADSSARGSGSSTATSPREPGRSRRADDNGAGKRRKPAVTKEPVRRAEGGDRTAGGAAPAAGAPVAARPPEEAPGSGSAGGENPSPEGVPAPRAIPRDGAPASGNPVVGSPAAPGAPPAPLPSAPPPTPAVPEVAPPKPVKALPVPAPTVEAPIAPPVKVKDKVNGIIKDKVTGNLKPDKIPGPKPGRGPPVGIGP